MLLCFGWKLDSGGIHGHSTGLCVVSGVPSLVHEMLLTSISSISIGFSYDSFSWDANCVMFCIRQFWVFMIYFVVHC